MAVTVREALLTAFCAHYGGRLSTVSAVRAEVERIARQSHGDGRLLNAARRGLNQFFVGDRVAIDNGNDLDAESFASSFDIVRRQLANMPGDDSGAHPNKNFGEAFTIAVCIGRRIAGQRVLLLTNDRNARLVAGRHGIPNRNIHHVLRELVCAQLITRDSAHEAFEATNTFSSIPFAERPSSADDFACHATEIECVVCARLA